MFSLEYSEIQEAIRDTARKYAQDNIAAGASDRDKNEIFPTEILKELGELGFMGMMVSPDWGGSGLDTLSYSIAIEEISKADASVAVVLSVQNSLVDWILEKFGSDFLKENYLTKLATGEFIGAYALSEAEAGSDATQLKTFAEKVGDKWVINGSKSWITSGKNADVFVVFAQTDFEKKHRGITAFLVEKGTPGFDIGKKEEKMGLRSSDTTTLSFTNAEIPEANMIGNLGQGFYIAMEGLAGGRIGIASQALGIAQGAFDLAAKYAIERKAFGKQLMEHQMIQQKIAQMQMKLSAARMLVHKVAWMKDAGIPHNQESSEAKLFASTIANEICRDAVQIHGGYGYTREYQVERMMRDAKVTEIYEGTSEIQHIVIAREVLKKYSE